MGVLPMKEWEVSEGRGDHYAHVFDQRTCLELASDSSVVGDLRRTAPTVARGSVW